MSTSNSYGCLWFGLVLAPSDSWQPFNSTFRSMVVGGYRLCQPPAANAEKCVVFIHELELSNCKLTKIIHTCKKVEYVIYIVNRHCHTCYESNSQKILRLVPLGTSQI